MKLRYTPRAIDQLTAIRNFIRDEYGNPKSAKRIIDAILSQCASLKQFPQSGTALSARFGIDTDIRYLVCEGYMIFYRIEGQYVSIGAVIHGKADYLHILFGNDL
ncbi:MAG: type II toxin-antitoxin system RelE/ParE family toxin [Butyricicoccus sp.]